jgi:copper(I)-binding protein
VAGLRVLIAGLLLLPLASLAAAQQPKADSVAVSEAWARATPGGVRNGAAFLQITASGAGDRLMDVRSGAAGRVELHSHIHEAGVMKMRRVEAIDVPAGKPVVFKPGGLHIMLMDLKQPLKAGEQVDLTLVFEKAGEIEVRASVEPIGAAGPASKAGPAGHAGSHKH